MLSEKNQAAVIAVFGHPIMLDEEGQDWNALLDYVRHQAQEEAKAETPAQYVERMTPFDTDALRGLLAEPAGCEDEIIRQAWALLQAYEAKAVSVEGWKLVPVEPTPEMLKADLGVVTAGSPVAGAIGKRIYESRVDLRPVIYRAMLAVAPQPPRDERPVAQCGGEAIAAMLEEDPFTIAPYRQAVGTTAALAPDHGWVLERARFWSATKTETAVKALAWNFLGMWREWQRHIGATESTTPDAGTEKVAAQVDQPIREELNPLPNQHTRDRIAELEAILRPVANLYGTKPPYVVIGRTVREAHFALQAKGAE